MSLKRFLGATLIIKGLEELDNKDVLDKYANKQRKEIMKAFPKRGDKILVSVIEDIIFPYVEILMGDNIKLKGLIAKWKGGL